MFNKNIKYSIRKLSVGIASVAIGVFLQTSIAHAQEATTTEQPTPVETKMETPAPVNEVPNQPVATPNQGESSANQPTSTETPATVAGQPQATPQAPQPVNQGSVKYRLEGNDQEVELNDFHDNKVNTSQRYELDKEIELQVPINIYTKDKKVYTLNHANNFNNPDGAKLNFIQEKSNNYHYTLTTTLTKEKPDLTFRYDLTGHYEALEFAFVESTTRLPVNVLTNQPDSAMSLAWAKGYRDFYNRDNITQVDDTFKPLKVPYKLIKTNAKGQLNGDYTGNPMDSGYYFDYDGRAQLNSSQDEFGRPLNESEAPILYEKTKKDEATLNEHSYSFIINTRPTVESMKYSLANEDGYTKMNPNAEQKFEMTVPYEFKQDGHTYRLVSGHRAIFMGHLSSKLTEEYRKNAPKTNKQYYLNEDGTTKVKTTFKLYPDNFYKTYPEANPNSMAETTSSYDGENHYHFVYYRKLTKRPVRVTTLLKGTDQVLTKNQEALADLPDFHENYTVETPEYITDAHGNTYRYVGTTQDSAPISAPVEANEWPQEGEDIPQPVDVKLVYEIVQKTNEDTPVHTLPELKVTQFTTQDGTQLAESELDTQVKDPKSILDYEYVETQPVEGGVRHVYKKVAFQIPNEDLKVETPEVKTTEFVNESGETIQEAYVGENLQAAHNIKGYWYDRTEETTTGQKHIYKPHIYKVPNNPPKVSLINAISYEYELENGEQLAEPSIRTSLNIRNFFGYKFIKVQRTLSGYKVIYRKDESRMFDNVTEKPEVKTTEFITQDGANIKDTITGESVKPHEEIKGYFYLKTEETPSGVKHIYKKVISQNADQALVNDKEQRLVTQFIDENNQPIHEEIFDELKHAELEINGYIYKESIHHQAGITHVYEKVKKDDEGTQTKPSTEKVKEETPKTTNVTPQVATAEVSNQKELPKTGELSNLLPLSLGLTTLGITLITWRKRQEQ